MDIARVDGTVNGARWVVDRACVGGILTGSCLGASKNVEIPALSAECFEADGDTRTLLGG